MAWNIRRKRTPDGNPAASDGVAAHVPTPRTVDARMTSDTDALDAYSTVVSTVAAKLLPSVAALAVRSNRGEGAGSCVSFTEDGFILTSAHVVAGAQSGLAEFTDGTQSAF